MALCRALLQKLCHDYCRRGVHGEFTLRFKVKDGTIQAAKTIKEEDHRPKG